MITPIQTEVELRHGVERARRGAKVDPTRSANAEPLKTTQSERDATRHNPNGATQDMSLIARTIAPLQRLRRGRVTPIDFCRPTPPLKAASAESSVHWA